MKAEREILRLQAYLDHELSPSDAARVAEWLANDEEARTYYDELRQVKLAMAGNELERSVPESREFYWEQIRRRIEMPENRAADAMSVWERFAHLKGWVRVGVPLAGAAAALAVLITMSNPAKQEKVASSYHEIETPVKEASSFSFHSPEAGLTVVWIETGGN